MDPRYLTSRPGTWAIVGTQSPEMAIRHVPPRGTEPSRRWIRTGRRAKPAEWVTPNDFCLGPQRPARPHPSGCGARDLVSHRFTPSRTVSHRLTTTSGRALAIPNASTIRESADETVAIQSL